MEKDATGEGWGKVDAGKADEGFSPNDLGCGLPGGISERNAFIMGKCNQDVERHRNWNMEGCICQQI